MKRLPSALRPGRRGEPPTPYNERIAQIASPLGIHEVDVLGDLPEVYEASGERLLIPWDGHNLALAKAAIARALAPHVMALKTTMARADTGS